MKITTARINVKKVHCPQCKKELVKMSVHNLGKTIKGFQCFDCDKYYPLQIHHLKNKFNVKYADRKK